MTLEELQESANRDLKIDETDLGSESINIPILHNKYLQHFNKFSLLLKKAEYEQKVLKRQKWEYYTGKMDSETLESLGWEPFQLNILKADIDKYLDSDTELSVLRMQISFTKEKVSYLESVVKIMNNRQWNIRSAIEWRKFINGV